MLNIQFGNGPHDTIAVSFAHLPEANRTPEAVSVNVLTGAGPVFASIGLYPSAFTCGFTLFAGGRGFVTSILRAESGHPNIKTMRYIPAAIALVCAMPALAQRQIDVKGSAGLASFVDESADHHLLTGGSARIYLTRRFSIEPEFLYLYRDNKHHDIILMPNIVWDFGGSRVVPYVTGGVGLLRTTDSGFRQSYSHNEGVVTAGGGVKIYLTDRWFIAPEVRVGAEAHVRISAGIGYTWRR